ncbi:MAG TPA: thiol:disulfide interchange protein DsbG [Gammaproteobacteria bacterium]|nr:thiol:disulfide interchange protein DsbG [Gammaproteobacteria bacterium]
MNTFSWLTVSCWRHVNSLRMRLQATRALLVMAFLGVILQTSTVAAAPQSVPPPTPWLALQHTRWIALGSAQPRHVVYVFTDPNCPYCHDLWLALRPYYRQGLQVRAVLVDVISSTSPGKAAAILEAQSPLAALRKNESGWGRRSDGGGGIAPLFHPQPAILEELKAHVALMTQFGIYGTPGIVFDDHLGKPHVIAGLPDNTVLAEIVRLAAAPK